MSESLICELDCSSSCFIICEHRFLRLWSARHFYAKVCRVEISSTFSKSFTRMRQSFSYCPMCPFRGRYTTPAVNFVFVHLRNYGMVAYMDTFHQLPERILVLQRSRGLYWSPITMPCPVNAFLITTSVQVLRYTLHAYTIDQTSIISITMSLVSWE